MITAISSDHAMPVIASAELRRRNTRSGHAPAWYATGVLK